MNIKRIISLLFILIALGPNANAELSRRVIRQWTDTIYYPFYNGVQMIELDFHQNYMRGHANGNVASPMGGKQSFDYRGRRFRNNILIFRNQKGGIIKSYNDSRSNPSYDGLKPVNALPKLAYHNRLRYIPSRRGGINYKLYGLYAFIESVSSPDPNGSDGYPKITYGLLDSLGNVVIKPTLTSIYIAEGKIFTDDGTKQHVLNADLSEFLPAMYSIIKPSGGIEGNYYIAQDSLWGMLDSNGIILLEPIYTSFYYADGNVIVTKGKLTGVLSSQGDVIIPLEMTYFERYSTVHIVAKKGKYGLMNLAYELFVDYKYEIIQSYRMSREYFQIKLNGKWGLISNKGEVIISCSRANPVTHQDAHLIREDD